MRVIAGSRRSIPLETVRGRGTRPTTDRIKETLFNMLQPALSECRFLDLFAGSGQIAIEALSRGAAYAVLVDSSRQAAACIERNLAKTNLKEQARLLCMDARAAMATLAGENEAAFDIVFLDPPYALDGQEELVSAIVREGLLREDGLVVLEAAIERVLDEAALAPLVVVRDKKYKSYRHVFLQRTGKSHEASDLSGEL